MWILIYFSFRWTSPFCFVMMTCGFCGCILTARLNLCPVWNSISIGWRLNLRGIEQARNPCWENYACPQEETLKGLTEINNYKQWGLWRIPSFCKQTKLPQSKYAKHQTQLKADLIWSPTAERPCVCDSFKLSILLFETCSLAGVDTT